MTALEYMQKRLERHRVNLKRITERNAPEVDIEHLKAKIRYYEAAVDALKKVEENNTGC